MAARPKAHPVSVQHAPGRDEVWAAIRQRRRFTWRELDAACVMGRTGIRKLLLGFLRGGFVALRAAPPLGARSGGPKRAALCLDAPLVLVRDVGVEAPRLRPDGTAIQHGDVQERLWRTMKVLAEFSAADLALHASLPGKPIGARDARGYLKRLAEAGYLAARSQGLPGQGRRLIYRFLRSRNTGPKPPTLLAAGGVRDTNTGQIWRDGAWTAGRTR